MLLVYGAAGLVLAAWLYGVTLIGARNPRSPAWANDFFVANLYVPLIIALAVAGIGSVVQFCLSVDSPSLGVGEAALVLGIVAVGWLVLKMMRIRKRLADFADRPTPVALHAIGSVDRNDPAPTMDPHSGNLAA